MARRAAVRDTDHGWAAAIRNMKRLGGNKKVQVGILGRVGGRLVGHNSGLNRATLMAIHEFGAPAANIPERAPIRRTYDRNLARYAAQLEAGVARILAGGATLDQVLDALGAQMALDVRNAIRGSQLPPPNAPSTIAKKGSAIPLIDYGELITSIGHEVVYGTMTDRRRRPTGDDFR